MHNYCYSQVPSHVHLCICEKRVFYNLPLALRARYKYHLHAIFGIIMNNNKLSMKQLFIIWHVHLRTNQPHVCTRLYGAFLCEDHSQMRHAR